MKKVSLIQVNFQQGPEDRNAFYLPYSVGCIWSYANSFDDIQNQYQLDLVQWRRDPVDEVAEKLRDQYLVAFSCYIWNRNYNYALAKAIKTLNRDCIILFGGPEPAVSDPRLFEKHPYIDLVIKKEGEMVFKNVLQADNRWQQVPGLVINQKGTAIDTGEPERINDLSVLPSPYLTGFFDNLIRSEPKVEWMATIETNRGCPYQCTFCDWGSLTYSKIRCFPLEKVLAELEWIARNRCGTLDCADANFGIFPERDNVIVDKFKELQDQYGRPYNWFTAWAKNQRPEVISIIKKLFDNRRFYNRGLNISLQTATDGVLSIIKRKNMHEITVLELYQMAQREQIPVFIEMILGLPGETLASWRESFFNLFRQGVHANPDVTICQLLENAEMNLVQKKLYDIQTAEIYDYLSGTYNNDAWPETISITTATSTMSRPHMKQALIFTWFITNFHTQGFSNIVSRFLYKYYKVDYADFYDRLYEQAVNHPWLSDRIKDIDRGIDLWFDTGRMQHPNLANGIAITSQNFLNALAMQAHLENRYDTMFELIERVLESFDFESSLVADVLCLQKNHLINFHDLTKFPKTHEFAYNVYDYIFDNKPLEPTNQILQFDFAHEKTMVTKEIIERIFYSRKNNFSQALVQVV